MYAKKTRREKENEENGKERRKARRKARKREKQKENFDARKPSACGDTSHTISDLLAGLSILYRHQAHDDSLKIVVPARYYAAISMADTGGVIVGIYEASGPDLRSRADVPKDARHTTEQHGHRRQRVEWLVREIELQWILTDGSVRYSCYRCTSSKHDAR